MRGPGRLVDATRVRLDLAAPSRGQAVEAALELLRGDPRVVSWEDFRRSVGDRQVIDLDGCAGGVVLAHGRSASVAKLALAAARWSAPDGPRLIFVFAIPSAMAGEYLRQVGALARACRAPDCLDALRSAATAGDFAERLGGLLD
jgi:mannitol/fructose-specific phosphotransferase system IIA component (Ntr-type)